MSWVTDRYTQLAPVHGHATGHVLVAEVLAELLAYWKTSDKQTAEQFAQVLPPVAPTQPTEIVIPIRPVDVTVPVSSEGTADGTAFRFNHSDLQKLSDKVQ